MELFLFKKNRTVPIFPYPKIARVRELYLSHFNTDPSDEKVDEIITLACEKFPQTQGAREEIKPVL